MTSDFQKGIISLIRSAIESKQVSLPDGFDWNEALKTSDAHQITPLIYYGVHKSGIELSDGISKKLKLETYTAAATDEYQSYELSKLFQAFSENNIDYMPLKGIILKQLYQNPEMRVMSDADLLIKVEKYKDISDLMKRLGYYVVVEGDPEVKWLKPPNMFIELHKRLFSSYDSDFHGYYGDGWQLARRSQNDNVRYEMCTEDQLIYLFTHFSKHYRNGGIGIKHLVDFWVFLNRHPELNVSYIQEELSKLQLYKFYINILYTIDVWFCGTAPNDMSDFITKRIFASGAYGACKEMNIASTVKVLKSNRSISSVRRKKILGIIFPPYSSMSIKYLALKKVPLLLPIFWVLRMVQTLLLKPQNIEKRRSDISNMTVENINRYHDELNYVGLDL